MDMGLVWPQPLVGGRLEALLRAAETSGRTEEEGGGFLCLRLSAILRINLMRRDNHYEYERGFF